MKVADMRVTKSMLGLLVLGAAMQVEAADTPPQTPIEAIGQTAKLPPPATARRSIALHGTVLRYAVTAGSLPVRDADGRTIGEVAYTAYLREGGDSRQRPVTFAINGGPGASSVFLNLGAMGPERLQFGAAGNTSSDAPTLTENPGSWLDFTDLVFIDPIGTGYSRSNLDDEHSNAQFYETDADIHYLSRFVHDWLVQNGRVGSPKYLAGESYGGFRVPQMIQYLRSDLGIGIKGGILISPFLDSGAEFDPTFSPIPWAVTLPGMAAARLEEQGLLDTEHMQPVIDYARGDFLRDLVAGNIDAAATGRLIDNVTRYTGLDPRFVRQVGGRITVPAYLREAHRSEGRIGSDIDSTFLVIDPDPQAYVLNAGDPILESVVAPATSAMVRYLRETVGWRVDRPYVAVSSDVGGRFKWHGATGEKVDSQVLRRVVAVDPNLRILIAHGWSDLSTPFMASRLLVDQFPPQISDGQVQIKEYPGGHMFFTRPASMMALHDDAAALYRAR
jgi:carboxypeptidase C (cathepsin A)